ncbi:MAG: ferritin-like domain-containing protein, partial [Burkholderiaceae bacterium]
MNGPSREQLIHSLYEAAELEHNLMCTYLYAAFSLKDTAGEGLSAAQGAAVARWRREIIDVAIEEMSHLAAVWNITAALGGVPRFGRMNFPLDPGYLPAGVVVKLAPFNQATLQHFIHLERPEDSNEPDGEGFAPERIFVRGAPGPRLTPMALDYETVGSFYATLGDGLKRLSADVGEDAAFCGDRSLQLSPAELDLPGAKPVICLKTALAAFDAIVLQGEGSPQNAQGSHYQRFVQIRTEYAAL